MTTINIIAHFENITVNCVCLPLIFQHLSLPFRHPHIQRLIQDPNTVLLFPGAKSQELASLCSGSDQIQYNLVLLDGTWMQAGVLSCQNPFMEQFRQVYVLLWLSCVGWKFHNSTISHLQSYQSNGTLNFHLCFLVHDGDDLQAWTGLKTNIVWIGKL